jgi:hypothetical protein
VGQFNQGTPERAFSDVAGSTAPVADNSGVHEINMVTGSLNALGSVFKTGMGIANARKETAQTAAVSEQTNSFEAKLLTAKDLAEQEGSNSLKFNNFLTKSFDESPLDFDVKAKMMKSFQATVLGKSFTEVSPEEQAREANITAAGKSGYWNSSSSEEDIELGTAEYEKTQQILSANTTEMSQLNLLKAQRGKTTAERAEVDRLMEKKQFSALANLAAGQRLPVKNEVESIVGQFQSGQIDRKTAEQMLTVARGDLNATIAQVTQGVDSAKVAPLTKPLLNLYDVALSYLGSTNLLMEVTNANSLATAQVVRNTQINNPQLVELAALSSMTNNSSPSLQAKFGEEASLVLKQNSKKGGKPVDPTTESEGVTTYLETVKDSASKLDQMGKDGQPTINIEEFVTNVDNVLGGGARYISEDDNPVDNQKILEWLANPQIGKGIKDNLSSFNATTRGKLSDTLTKSAVNHIYPKTTSIMRGDLKPTELDKIQVVNQGNKVVFRATTQEPWIKSVAQKLNREVGGALSTYYNAIGNVTGEGFSSVFDREKDILWPDGQTEANPTQGEGGQDFSQHEGKVGVDTKGNRFVIRNGVPVAVGSDDG